MKPELIDFCIKCNSRLQTESTYHEDFPGGYNTYKNRLCYHCGQKCVTLEEYKYIRQRTHTHLVPATQPFPPISQVYFD